MNGISVRAIIRGGKGAQRCGQEDCPEGKRMRCVLTASITPRMAKAVVKFFKVQTVVSPIVSTQKLLNSKRPMG